MREGAPYRMRVSSQKGGVGKTTVAVNLATALTLQGYKVLLIDGDYTNPSVGFHLGFEQVNRGFIDVATSNVGIDGIIIKHAPTGMYVLPGRIAGPEKEPTPARMQELFRIVDKKGYNFVIVDSPPGYIMHDIDLVKDYDEAVLVTTPEMSACTSALRLARHYDKEGLKHSLIINRIRNRGYEVSTQEIEESYDGQIIAGIPEDDIVPLSVAEHIPAYLLSQRCKFSGQIRKAARKYAAKLGSSPVEMGMDGGIGIFQKILAIFGFRRKNRIRESLEG